MQKCTVAGGIELCERTLFWLEYQHSKSEKAIVQRGRALAISCQHSVISNQGPETNNEVSLLLIAEN